MRILQSSVERLAWYVVVLLLIAVGIIIYQQYREQAQIKNGVMTIETQISCISQYFNKTDRANIVINNLNSCNIKRQ